MPLDFDACFSALTGNEPFPWQHELYRLFAAGQFEPCKSCNLPTGLGKTAVIAIWLIALANNPIKVPRRLVYVVNRRTVVDQSTAEAERYRAKAAIAGLPFSLAISTLRGQFADNREWSADPSRPAVIVGTVDMIGSRLLFSGYGVGFKSKPLHAGFLGQDVLIVHDEAHLEPAFQDLLVAVEKEQRHGERTSSLPWPKMRVMELSATSRGADEVFELTNEEMNPPSEIPVPPTEPIHHVWMRLTAKKGIKFHPSKRDEVAAKIGRLARDRKTTAKAVLIFVRTIHDVGTVQKVLTDKKEGVPADQVQVLTGTLRGLERDQLTSEDPVFARFLPAPKIPPKQGTVYLVCTSAGEVGVDISADHMVCDLTTFDSMVQRLGRVNRRGGRGGGAAEIDVVYETDPDPKQKDNNYEKARWNTLAILRTLPNCTWISDRQEGSPLALRNLNLTDDERKTAFAPEPIKLLTSDILFDSWALTTIREKLPGRPPVEPYLHGLSDWEPPETYVAWREEVERLSPEKFSLKYLEELLEDYPLKPHELLRGRTYGKAGILEQLEVVAERAPNLNVWLVDLDGSLAIYALARLVEKDKQKKPLVSTAYRTVILPPAAGALAGGLLKGDEPYSEDASYDVADHWFQDNEKKIQRRNRVDSDEPRPARIEGMRLVRTIDTKPDIEDDEEKTSGKRFWHWYVRPGSADDDGSKTAPDPIGWQHHTDDVVRNAEQLADALLRECPDLQKALVLAAKFHDLGKKRELWQWSIGNPNPTNWLGKSGGRMKPREFTNYRHEFGSLLDVLDPEQRYLAEFQALTEEMQDVVLHLIAVHHGLGRPHFPPDNAFDPKARPEDAAKVAAEVLRRFARLQRKYGRWGLAYLESLLRAADWAASAKPSRLVEEGT